MSFEHRRRNRCGMHKTTSGENVPAQHNKRKKSTSHFVMHETRATSELKHAHTHAHDKQQNLCFLQSKHFFPNDINKSGGDIYYTFSFDLTFIYVSSATHLSLRKRKKKTNQILSFYLAHTNSVCCSSFDFVLCMSFFRSPSLAPYAILH